MWDYQHHLWLSTTQIRRGREPSTEGSYADTIVCRCSWRPNNGQVLSTQAHRSALTDFATCPPLVPLLLIYKITSVRAFTELSSRCFQVPTLMPFSIRVHKRILRRGNIQPLCFVIHGPNSTWRQAYHFNKIILSQHHRVSQHPNQTEDVCQPVSPLGPMEP